MTMNEGSPSKFQLSKLLNLPYYLEYLYISNNNLTEICNLPYALILLDCRNNKFNVFRVF